MTAKEYISSLEAQLNMVLNHMPDNLSERDIGYVKCAKDVLSILRSDKEEVDTN